MKRIATTTHPLPAPVLPRRRWLGRAALALAACASLWGAQPGAVQAQDFPTKSVTIVVPFPAGGTTDLLARILGQHLSQQWGQSVVIDNKGGAGGNIGAQAAARAAADGHTLLMGTVGTHAINQSLYKKLPYDPVKDFQPLSRVALVPNLLVAHPKQPYKTVQELLDYARANPGKVDFASSGNGTSIHLSAELFKQMASVDMQHIPYKGSAPAGADLLAGQVHIMFDNMPSAIQNVRAGRLVPLAVTTATRSAQLPDVPTIAEAGVPGFEAYSWFGLFAPAGTPEPVVERLSQAITKALKDPQVVQKFAEQGAIAHPETPAEFATFIDAEAKKWQAVVKASGASVD